MTEALLMREENGGDRWSIGDLRDRSPTPRIDRLLAGAEASAPVRGELETRLERLEQRVDEFERRLGRLSDNGSTRAAGYTLFFRASRGYDVANRDGIAPDVGTSLIVEDQRYVVEGTRRSPFPADTRPCLVLSPLPPEQTADSTTNGA